MKKARQTFLKLLFLFILPFASQSVFADLITEIMGLDVSGTSYDVTFHTGAGNSFNDLWDQDNDNVFGGGTSVFSEQPTFWGNQGGADTARDAIMASLGFVDTVNATGDAIAVPYERLGFTPITIQSEIDQSNLTATDAAATVGVIESSEPSTFAWASFALSGSVPEPSTFSLMIATLLGLRMCRQRRKERNPS